MQAFLSSEFSNNQIPQTKINNRTIVDDSLFSAALFFANICQHFREVLWAAAELDNSRKEKKNVRCIFMNKCWYCLLEASKDPSWIKMLTTLIRTQWWGVASKHSLYVAIKVCCSISVRVHGICESEYQQGVAFNTLVGSWSPRGHHYSSSWERAGPMIKLLIGGKLNLTRIRLFEKSMCIFFFFGGGFLLPLSAHLPIKTTESGSVPAGPLSLWDNLPFNVSRLPPEVTTSCAPVSATLLLTRPNYLPLTAYYFS